MSIKLLFIIGLSLDVTGAVILVFYSPFVPWNIRSWKGDSQAEKAWERRMSMRRKVGLCFLIVGFSIQALGYVFD